jgi:subtilisin
VGRRVGATVVAAVLAASAVAALAGAASAAPPEGPNGPPGRYIVVLEDSVADPGAVAAEHSRAYNAQVSFVYTSAIRGYAAVIPNERVAEVRSDARVAYISDYLPVEAVQPPGGTPPGNGRGGGRGGGAPPPQTLPTGVDRIDGEGKSPVGNVAAAVIDTGSGPHGDLNVVGGKNCSTGASYNDGNGHGTHVAGTIGAVNNTVGVVGIAPGMPIYSVRVLNNAGSGSWSSIICGIDWVTGNRAALNIRVANMSLGGSTTENDSAGCTSSALHQAICNSVNAGVTYVAAAGNSAANFATFAPATYDEVLTATAMSDSDGQPLGTGGPPTCRTGETDDAAATFSNFATSTADQEHTIAAPGVCILSTWSGGGYNTISGTSMASPHVTGTAALCIAHGVCTGTPANIRSKLRNDAAARPASYAFIGSPQTGSRYFGYLAYAGGY